MHKSQSDPTEDAYFNQDLDQELKDLLSPVCEIHPDKKHMHRWRGALRSSLAAQPKIKRSWYKNPWAIGFLVNTVMAVSVVIILPLSYIQKMGQALRLEFAPDQKSKLIDELRHYHWTKNARVLTDRDDQIVPGDEQSSRNSLARHDSGLKQTWLGTESGIYTVVC